MPGAFEPGDVCDELPDLLVPLVHTDDSLLEDLFGLLLPLFEGFLLKFENGSLKVRFNWTFITLY